MQRERPPCPSCAVWSSVWLFPECLTLIRLSNWCRCFLLLLVFCLFACVLLGFFSLVAVCWTVWGTETTVDTEVLSLTGSYSRCHLSSDLKRWHWTQNNFKENDFGPTLCIIIINIKGGQRHNVFQNEGNCIYPLRSNENKCTSVKRLTNTSQ